MSPKKLFSLTVVILISMILPALSPVAMGAKAATENPASRLTSSSSAAPNLDDPAELQSFFNELITAQLNEQHVPGATLAVVKDGELLFSKGYGYANVETKAPVIPDKTVFLVGSNGKLFTWTAVMQLYEQGRLDLDADVNQYIDFRIPDTFPEPITLKHLLTHTPGFEDTPFGFGSNDPEALVPIGIWLADNIPARMWPPGQIPAYSNYGTALAGYIVERVSGMPFEAYIEQNILSPLGMAHSTLRQPVPPELAADQAIGYIYVNGTFQPQDAEYVSIIPAGGLRATATDMARFMITHLQDGRYCEPGCASGEVRILDESTAQQMHTRLWAADERLNGMAHGFIELSQNGVRLIGHPGDTSLFHSILALLPEHNVGLFVSYNSLSSRGLPSALLDAFMDHFFPGPMADQPISSRDFSASAGRLQGTYQVNRLDYTGGGKILGPLNSVTVQAGSNDELLLNMGGPAQRFTEVAPLFFQEVDGDVRLFFREDASAGDTYLYFHNYPYMAAKKVAWYDTQLFNIILLAFCTLLFLSVLIVELVRLVVGLFRRRNKQTQPRQARLAHGVMVAMALLGLLLVVGLILFVLGDSWARVSGQRGMLTVLGWMSILAVLLAAGMIILAGLSWRAGWWRMPARLAYSLVAFGSAALVWFLAYWNQLGWQWW